jgi:hypothetical protein
MFWPTVSRPISLGVGHTFGTHDQILLFPFYYSAKLLCPSSWGALSDERTGLYFVVQSVSGQSRGGLITIHYCLIRDYWVPFPSPLTIRRDYGGSILTRLHTGSNSHVQWVFLINSWARTSLETLDLLFVCWKFHFCSLAIAVILLIVY